MDERREQLEAFPYELDVCELCGEVFRDADRGVVHGCLTVAPPFGDISVLYRLQAIAADAEKQGLGVVSLIAGAELFNALELEVRPYLRRDEPMGYWRLRTRHVHSAWRRTIAISGAARVSVDLERTLPVWALQVRRPTYRAHPTLDPYEVGRIARGLFDRDELRAMYDRPSPLLGMLPKRENFSGPTVTLVNPADALNFEANMRVDVAHDASVRHVAQGTFQVTIPDGLRVVADPAVPPGLVYVVGGRSPGGVSDALERELRAHTEAVARLIAPETEPELRTRHRAERRNDRASRRAVRTDDATSWNGTPRALRTTRKPWER